MSLESFFGFETGEGMSEGALEALREKMRAAAAQIAAIKREESKQKKTEEELYKILKRFVQTSHKTELVLLISRVLEQNLPANFILAIILLGNPEIQQEVGKFLMLKAQNISSGSDSQVIAGGNSPNVIHGDNLQNEEPGNYSTDTETMSSSSEDRAETSSGGNKSLIFFTGQDKSLPLKIRIELDSWIKNMLFQAQENPQKLLKTAYKSEMIELPREYDWEESQYEQKQSIQPIIIQLITYVLRDFLIQNKVDEPYNKLYDFSEFILTGILNKTKEALENRQLLK